MNNKNIIQIAQKVYSSLPATDSLYIADVILQEGV